MGFTVMATQRHSLSTSSQQCVKEKHMKSTFRNVNDIHLHISPIFWMGIKRLQWWWVNLHTMGPPGHNLDVSLRHVSSGDLPESRGPGIFALADPQWCVSQTSGVQNTPHFFYGYDDTVYTASFSREFMRYSFKKNWCLECILTQHTNTCSTPLPGFDSLRPNSPKKKHWRWWSSSPTCGTRNFQAPGVFCLGGCIVVRLKILVWGENVEGLLKFIDNKIHRAGVSHAPPPKGKNNHFLDIHSSILPKQNEKTASGVSGFLWFSGNQGNFQR